MSVEQNTCRMNGTFRTLKNKTVLKWRKRRQNGRNRYQQKLVTQPLPTFNHEKSTVAIYIFCLNFHFFLQKSSEAVEQKVSAAVPANRQVPGVLLDRYHHGIPQHNDYSIGTLWPAGLVITVSR